MKKIILLMTLALIAMFAFAQTKVTGTVLEETGDGAIGANIVAEGTTVGTVTDFDGYFELNVPAGVKNLIISYMGYKTMTVPVKPQIKVTLVSDAQQIAEVVVQGMVKQDKRIFTGATTKLDAEDTKLAGVADVSRSLEGKAAGVSVQNVSGTFGTAPKIRVRGATSILGSSKPLWVVDGVVMEDVCEVDADNLSSGDAATLISNAISGLNADDIESFQILKDGSATSIYGARAMAGVIVVTTKKGQAGVSKLNYTAELTYRMVPTYNDYNICNSQEQMGIYKELESKGWLEFTRLSQSENYGVYGKMYELIDTYQDGHYILENTPAARNAYLRQAETRNTNWFDYLFNHTIMHTHSLSFSTGTEKATVYASVSAMHDPGWYKQSGVKRFTGNVNANFNILKNFSIGIATSGSYRDQQAPGTNDSSVDVTSGQISRDFDINPFSFAMNTSRALDPKMSYRRNYTDFNITDELDQNYIQLKQMDVKFQANMNYKPVRGLEINALGSIRYNTAFREHHVMDNSNQARAYRAGIVPEDATIRDSNKFLYKNPDDPNALPQSVLPNGGAYTQWRNSLLQVDFRGTVSYNADLGKNGDHIVNIFAGAELNYADWQANFFRGWGYQYENGGVPYYDYNMFKQGQEEGTDYYEMEYEYYRNLAFFAMGTYSYKGRYTINGTIRVEGSNQLGRSANARWLPTWNVSGAWNAHEENFWRGAFDEWWTVAKLKASYSLTGDRGPINNSQAVYRSYTPYRPLSSVQETGIQWTSLENSELTYEKKHELNVGTELSFVKNRINVQFDVYFRNNYDLIGRVQTAGVGGTVERYANAASMKSQGCELTLSTVNIKQKDFTWTTDFTFAHAKNTITDLSAYSPMYALVYGTGYALEGYPVRALFSIPFAGLTEDGLPTFYTNKEHTETTMTDINFQQYQDLDFLKYEGSVDPLFTGGFRNTFRWKGVTLDVFFTYSAGNVLRLDPLCFVNSSDYNDLAASKKEFSNRWMVPGDEQYTTIPVIASSRQYHEIQDLRQAYSAYNYSTERIAKGDFIRLKDISISYDLPKRLFEGQKAVSSFGLKFTATNVCLVYADKKLNGQDPEFYNTGGVSSPNPRQFTLSLRLGM